jgi:uncharacterized protein (TIGR02246 family)
MTQRRAPAAGQTNAEQAAVARRTAALLTAVNASDVAGILAVWSADGVLMPPHHPSVHGRAEIKRYFNQLFQRRRFKFSFTSSLIEIFGETAFERVEYDASVWPTDGGPEVRDVGKGLHVYRRERRGSWKLVADIWNSDKPVNTGQ